MTFRLPTLKSRRNFLGGAAAVISLPMLDSFAGKRAHAARPSAPRRLIVYHVPNGFYRATFTPTGGERDFKLSPTLAPLAPFRNDILIPRGVANTVAVPVPFGGAHAVGCGALLTCRFPDKSKLRAGISFDQVAATALGDKTMLPSLQLGIDNHPGVDENGWAAAYQRHISWKSEDQPLPNIISPGRAFDRMFQGFDPHLSRTERARRHQRRASVLDTVAASAQTLSANINAEDKQKLDEYLTSIRDFETQLDHAARPVRECHKADFRYGDETLDLPTRVDQFHKIMCLALQCDVTRVITFQMGNGLSPTPYPHLGFSDNGHAITHHSGDKDKIAKCEKVDRWRVEQFAAFLGLLRGTADVDGTNLLANSVVVLLSEVGDGNRHDHQDKPMVLAGQLGGTLKTGRMVFTRKPDGDNTYDRCDEYVRTTATPLPAGCVESPQLAQLYMALLERLGAKVPTFGDFGRAPLEL